jgi:hypothetical protein
MSHVPGNLDLGHCVCVLPHGHGDSKPVCFTQARTSNRFDEAAMQIWT